MRRWGRGKGNKEEVARSLPRSDGGLGGEAVRLAGESGTRCANMERRLGFLEGLILQWMNVGESPIRAPEGAA